jgi:prepilin-type N-terminal cleavage/methylation domain-containing protein
MNDHRRRATRDVEPASRVHGFTLVEMLVVIAIIGTLVAMLLPAVQRARESSRRSRCSNNLRNIALATVQYEDRLRSMPGLFDPIQPERMKSGSGYPNTIWPVTILPDLERAGIAAPNQAGELTSTYVEVFVCPSDGSKTRTGADLSYVANGGRLDSVVFEKLANGPFVNHVYHPKLLMAEGHWMDGRDYTLMYSESTSVANYANMGWNGWKKFDPWTLDAPKFISPDADDRTWGPVFLWTTDPKLRVGINMDGPDPSTIDCKEKITDRYSSASCNAKNGILSAMWARPSSNHGGGVNVAFASGRVLFLREDVDYGVFIALMTPFDKKSDSPNPNYQLGDNDIR